MCGFAIEGATSGRRTNRKHVKSTDEVHASTALPTKPAVHIKRYGNK
jgi:hypothetical protein